MRRTISRRANPSDQGLRPGYRDGSAYRGHGVFGLKAEHSLPVRRNGCERLPVLERLRELQLSRKRAVHSDRKKNRCGTSAPWRSHVLDLAVDPWKTSGDALVDLRYGSTQALGSEAEARFPIASCSFSRCRRDFYNQQFSSSGLDGIRAVFIQAHACSNRLRRPGNPGVSHAR